MGEGAILLGLVAPLKQHATVEKTAFFLPIKGLLTRCMLNWGVPDNWFGFGVG